MSLSIPCYQLLYLDSLHASLHQTFNHLVYSSRPAILLVSLHPRKQATRHTPPSSPQRGKVSEAEVKPMLTETP